MKKLLFILILCLATNAFAQNSFPTSNAIWNESVKGNYSIYGLLGDTTFSSVVYSKFYELSDTLLSEANIKHYVGAFRNEGQKVYFKPANWVSQDIILYDFAAEVGDTIWHNAKMLNYYNIAPCSESGCYSIVVSISIINNTKIYDLDSGGAWITYYIEGVGSVNGILRSMVTLIPMSMSEDDFKLNCFKHNDTVKYVFNSNCNNKCFCPTSNILENLHSDIVNIFPNPTKDILNIKVSENTEIKSIEIYSIEGKLLEKYISFYSGQLNISKLNAGTYVIHIETSKGYYKQLIIKE